VVILVASVVAALVAVGIYLQRGYQGYLRGAASSHGVQFDPQDFSETRQLKSFGQTQEIDILSGQAAVDLFAGDSRLPSTPGGSLPARTLATKATVTTDWDVGRDATYQAQ
jgi:hypothetical protein